MTKKRAHCAACGFSQRLRRDGKEFQNHVFFVGDEKRQCKRALPIRPADDPGPEPCACCSKLTTWWYEPNDVALCARCAEEKTAKEIPSKAAWFDAHYRGPR